jgi:hypothetical protein
MLFKLCVTVVLCAFISAAEESSDKVEALHGGMLDDFTSLVYGGFDSIVNSMGLGEKCPWKENMMESVAEALPKNIRGQNEGVKSIVKAIAGWEMQKKSGQSRPLVMAITGSTGVGKSETSYQLADALLARKSRIGNTKRYLPEGLLVFRGEDYSPESSISLQEAHHSIRSNLLVHLKKCGSRGIIVFDEVQKVMPGTLDVLMPAFEERGAIIEYNNTNGRSGGLIETVTEIVVGRSNAAGSEHEGANSYSTAECIFLFISDIGSAKMIRLLLKHGNRDLIPRQALRNEVKASLDEQWERLIFGKVINEVVPYLPMEQQHIEEVLRVKLDRLDTINRDAWWVALAVDDDVVSHLAGPTYLKYVNFTSKAKIAPNTATTLKDMNVDGTASSEGLEQVSSASKVVAKYGARALENGGPLQDLRALVFTTMQPWRPHQVLHVGLADSTKHTFTPTKLASVREEASEIRTSSSNHNNQVYLQWCKLTGQYRQSHTGRDGRLSVDETEAFSPQCETVYVGKLHDLA